MFPGPLSANSFKFVECHFCFRYFPAYFPVRRWIDLQPILILTLFFLRNLIWRYFHTLSIWNKFVQNVDHPPPFFQQFRNVVRLGLHKSPNRYLQQIIIWYITKKCPTLYQILKFSLSNQVKNIIVNGICAVLRTLYHSEFTLG